MKTFLLFFFFFFSFFTYSNSRVYSTNNNSVLRVIVADHQIPQPNVNRDDLMEGKPK